MKRALLLLALVAAGCGGSPAAPTVPPTPPPPVYPNMVGGWGGMFTDTAVPNTGSYVCNMTLLVQLQTLGAFSGTFQASPGNSNACGVAGTIGGTVTPTGEINVRLQPNTAPTCTHDYGDGNYRGFLSPSGAITVQTQWGQTCRGTAYQMTSVVTVNRR